MSSNLIECRVLLKRPHPQQRAILLSRAKRKMIRAGRRWGKTTVAAILAVEQFLAGRRVLYAAPTDEQLGKFWREVKWALAEAIEAGAFHKNETEHTIERPGTNQRIKAKTAWNADTLRGDYADLLILDEWQLMDETAWDDVGAPMLLDINGDAIFVYTPPSLARKPYRELAIPATPPKCTKRPWQSNKLLRPKADPPGWQPFTSAARTTHISRNRPWARLAKT